MTAADAAYTCSKKKPAHLAEKKTRKRHETASDKHWIHNLFDLQNILFL